LGQCRVDTSSPWRKSINAAVSTPPSWSAYYNAPDVDGYPRN
jgi:hypothetical protein